VGVVHKIECKEEKTKGLGKKWGIIICQGWGKKIIVSSSGKKDTCQVLYTAYT